MHPALVKAAMVFLYRSPLRNMLLTKYTFQFNPVQLHFLCDMLEQAIRGPGLILEVGCWRGSTTVFLNRHLDAIGVKRDYVCVDTFGGFVSEDIDVEVNQRNKRVNYKPQFTVNCQRWFDLTMKINKCGHVRSIKADAKTFDYASLGPISFCLLDVDLYAPSQAALPQIYRQLDPGGVIVVDDCHDTGIYDGAGQAYREFTAAEGLPAKVAAEKLGVICKPAVTTQPQRESV